MSSDKDSLKNALHDTLRMMRDSGFEISGNVDVVVDPKLPFMGYSMQRGGGNVVVVAGRALKSGMIEGLLIHEMCHIYRTDKNHPSHNKDLLNHIGHVVIHENQVTKGYQIKLIQQAVNHIQDLYADDLAFKVFKENKLWSTDQAFDFFLSWIQDTPVSSKTTRARWLNLGVMLNNCFAISNMTRHKVKDVDNKAENAVERFLSQTDDLMKKEFTYYKNFMINLKENTTEEQFEKDLTEYLTRIIMLAQNRTVETS
jgi:hypothetical protein